MTGRRPSHRHPIVARALAVVLGLLVVGCGGGTLPHLAIDRRPSLTFGFLPYADDSHMRALFDAVGTHLEQHLNRPVHFVLASDYETMGRLMDGKLVDIVWFTPASFAKVGRRVGARALCKPVRRGRSTYRPVVVVREESPYKSLADLKGTRFGYVDRNSTSGFVIPNELLALISVTDPLAFFSQIEFTYSHARSLQGLAEGRFDAIAVYEGAPKELVRNLGTTKVRTLASGPAVPNDPIAVRPDMEPALVEKIRTLMLDMEKMPTGQRALVALANLESISRFVPTSDADYHW